MPLTVADSSYLCEAYRAVRQQTEHLCEPLEPDDFLLQYDADCSPPKWQLAHTTWFFETFVLKEFATNYQPFLPQFNFLFNSYYDAVGSRWPRPKRGLLSRPTLPEVRDYRRVIDDQVLQLLHNLSEEKLAALRPVLELGIHHEQQHQELLLTDLKPSFAANPLRPVYQTKSSVRQQPSTLDVMDQLEFWSLPDEGLYWVGTEGEHFHFDNEGPRHRVFIDKFAMCLVLVTVGDYLKFMNDGGYRRPEFWLSDGWAVCQREQWYSPMYWEQEGKAWHTFTLNGMQPIDVNEPVVHISFYEADAYARWAGARLPTEAEWEFLAGKNDEDGNFLENARFHPQSYAEGARLGRFYGDVWEWTASPYVPYPGYKPSAGALGEYNGKFMCNQMVLRGGSCATPRHHIRRTYRNFFPPETRRQFSGLRLAKDHL